MAEIYDGESCDGRKLEQVERWLKSNLGPIEIKAAEILPAVSPDTDLMAMDSAPMRRIESIQPVKKTITPSNKLILDLGQNLVGVVKLKNITGHSGLTITLRHAEVREDAELGVRPLRTAKATDSYTLRGDQDCETWSPSFTFHGFRYVQIDRWPPETSQDVLQYVEAIVVHTETKLSGTFNSSNPSLNPLHSNINCPMHGNYTSLPTNCPQRDERLGWTGDIALFAPTATFLYRCTGFLISWLKEVLID
jgi:alpha-L-rhamnosidase